MFLFSLPNLFTSFFSLPHPLHLDLLLLSLLSFSTSSSSPSLLPPPLLLYLLLPFSPTSSSPSLTPPLLLYLLLLLGHLHCFPVVYSLWFTHCLLFVVTESQTEKLDLDHVQMGKHRLQHERRLRRFLRRKMFVFIREREKRKKRKIKTRSHSLTLIPCLAVRLIFLSSNRSTSP